MIQRVQTVFLLLAAALVVTFMFVPFGYADFAVAAGSAEVVREAAHACSEIGLMIPLCCSAVLYVVAIFLYKNLKVQKTVTGFGILMACVAALVTIYVLVAGAISASLNMVVLKTYWGGGGLILVGAIVAGIMAFRGIASDERLLRSYDSIR